MYMKLSNKPWAYLKKKNVFCFVLIHTQNKNYIANKTSFQTITKTDNQWKNISEKFLNDYYEGKVIHDPRLVPLYNSKPKSTYANVKHFIDYKVVHSFGGNGGDGCISHLQLFRNPHAGPDGGDGGHGGHVIFQAAPGRRSLEHLERVIRGKDGVNGRNKNCHGKNAEDTVVDVPLGTVIRYYESTESVTLDKANSMFIAARGGAGGKGNSFFATDVDHVPKVAEHGGEGESIKYELELKTMADVGLIGFPNAGKSTLLRAISRARPKVAAYPFTTLNPYVGMILYDDQQQLSVADIPGLIEGSHKDKGLGISFLKHIERCSCLLYVIDCAEPLPWNQIDILKNELNQYQEGLAMLPHAIVANKFDLPEAQANMNTLKEKMDLPVIPISAKMGEGLVPLLSLMRLLVILNCDDIN